SKPSRWAWRLPVVVIQGAPGIRPSCSTRAPARGPRALRPCTAALVMPARARDVSARGSRLSSSASEKTPRRRSRRSTRGRVVGGWRGRVEAQRRVGGFCEHAIEEQRVAVHVELEARAKALDHGHRARLAVGPPGAPRPPAIPPEHGAHEDRDDGPTERVVEGAALAQAVRHGEHPLPDGYPGQDRLDEIRRLRHAPPAATGAHGVALARQRDEALERTGVAPNAQKAVREDATAEEGAELPFDEVGRPTPSVRAAAAAPKGQCARS